MHRKRPLGVPLATLVEASPDARVDG
jgi:hypothetical protein